MRIRWRLLLLCLGSVWSAVAPAAEWGYHRETEPGHWAALSDDNVLCATGLTQSPIDLSGATQLVLSEVEREIGSSELNVDVRAHVLDLVDNGHTIQVTSDAAVSMTVDDRTFKLVQFHFHAPSEHTIEGEHAPLEATW